jgi:predicted exporter
VEEISYTLTSGNATMEKYVYLANLTLTDTRFPNEGSGIYQRKVLSLGYKDLKQISKTELICMSLRRLWIYSSLRVLTIQKICLIC